MGTLNISGRTSFWIMGCVVVELFTNVMKSISDIGVVVVVGGGGCCCCCCCCCVLRCVALVVLAVAVIVTAVDGEVVFCGVPIF